MFVLPHFYTGLKWRKFVIPGFTDIWQRVFVQLISFFVKLKHNTIYTIIVINYMIMAKIQSLFEFFTDINKWTPSKFLKRYSNEISSSWSNWFSKTWIVLSLTIFPSSTVKFPFLYRRNWTLNLSLIRGRKTLRNVSKSTVSSCFSWISSLQYLKYWSTSSDVEHGLTNFKIAVSNLFFLSFWEPSAIFLTKCF